jgi:hypothetical protein
MDTKPEKLALFRYGLIASLVIERLPRGELTRRARRSPPAPATSPIPNGRGFASIPCSIGRYATATAVSKHWLPNRARTGDSPAR